MNKDLWKLLIEAEQDLVYVYEEDFDYDKSTPGFEYHNDNVFILENYVTNSEEFADLKIIKEEWEKENYYEYKNEKGFTKT